MLTRTLRLAASPLIPTDSSVNGLVGGGHPSGLAAIGELEIEVAGPLQASGYLIDIGTLDGAMRAAAAPRFSNAMRLEATTGAPTDVASILRDIARDAGASLPVRLTRLTYRASPYRSCSIQRSSGEDSMTDAILSETFDFAASHRLHLADRSDGENRQLFGKCNNPNGHGHNYRIEVAASPDGAGEGRFGFRELEQAVAAEIIARFDHKHLNLDCPEFRTVNPSVENIARICHDLLKPAIAGAGGALRFVRVWETEKTSCIYPASAIHQP